jgi:DNA transformation protein
VAVSGIFLDAVRDALAFVPDLHTKRMFGGVGVYSGELMFALAIEDTLYLKTAAAGRPAFEALGLQPFTYTDGSGNDRATSYFQAPDVVWEDPDAAREWVAGALACATRKKR